ncbi:hypothetical protein [Pseudomonas sp. 28 E 9]|jgi:LysR family transcriptional regulator for bpeEF and oprC|nr:hypothetical protein [Pseudomonas sp. 28 E 9]
MTRGVPEPVPLLPTDRNYRSPKVRAFMDWLVAVFAEQGLS